MKRNTKELDYIKKVWEEKDGPGKDERRAPCFPSWVANVDLIVVL